MDQLKNAIGGGNKNTGSSTTGQPAQGQAQNQDYGDKAGAYVDKNYMGGKVGTSNMEKVTDAARSQFEKATGKDIPDKVSN